MTSLLAVPPAPRPTHKRNFLQQVVCELKFPTLFELDSAKPPVSFAQALRKDYPNYQHATDFVLGGEKTNVHLFRSLDNGWTVSIRTSSIVIEAMRYTSFERFEERLVKILRAASQVIDSEFFTRVGLRYINALPWNKEEIHQWIRPELSGVVSLPELGQLRECFQRLSGPTDTGGFLLQHGLGVNTSTHKNEYILDFDFFQENVEVKDTAELVRAMHKQEFDLFWWALGPKAQEALLA